MNSKTSSQSLDDIEQEFDGALVLRDAGQVAEALRILQGLALRKPDAGPVFGMIAGIQYEMGDLDGARENFRRTTELSPRSELASRGLFHALYELGRLSEAFEEAARYRSIKPSVEYDATLEELLVEAESKLKENKTDEFLIELLDRVTAELRERPRQKESVE